ncbi:MAG: hypothetical protein JWP58_4602 [Hymenobacter sp.]|jgi:hypothetical protein|nr:hypothetical protein [Hymenobacter sp.]
MVMEGQEASRAWLKGGVRHTLLSWTLEWEVYGLGAGRAIMIAVLESGIVLLR